MKYNEEYRNPVAAKQLQQAIASVTTRPWTIMEVCGGQTHTIVKYGIDELLPPEVELVHGPGCPVCVTPLEMIDKAMAIAVAARSDFLLVRRHAPRTGEQQRFVRGEGGGRRRANRLFAARLPQNCGEQHPEQTSGVLRRRLRNDGAGQRDGRLAGRAARGRRISRAGFARVGPSRDDRRPVVAGKSRAGLFGGRSRLRGDGLRGVRTAGRRNSGFRSSSRVSSRSICWTALSLRLHARSGADRSRKPIRPRGARAKAIRRPQVGRRGVRGRPTASGAASARFRRADCRLRPEYARFDAERRFAVSQLQVPESEHVHQRSHFARGPKTARLPGVRQDLHAGAARWGRRWFLPRGPVRLTTITAGIGRRKRFMHEGKGRPSARACAAALPGPSSMPNESGTQPWPIRSTLTE